jgi:O-antigen ligase
MAPLVVLPGHLDFSRLPQQLFVQLAALALGVLWLAGDARCAVVGPRRPLDRPLLVFLAWSGLSVLTAADPGAGLRTMGHWSACALVYLFVSRTARSRDVPRLGAALLLGGAAVAVVGLGQALFGLDVTPQAVGPAATLANCNGAAGYLVVLAPLVLLPWTSRRARTAAVAGALTMLAFLPFTRSRSAAVAVALQLALLAARRDPARRVPAGRNHRGTWALLVGAGLVLAAAAGLTLGDRAKARSVSIRVDLLVAALSMARQHPLLGVGLGSFGAAYPSHGPVVTSALGAPLRVESPHAEAQQVLAETGLPGLLALLWGVASVLASLRRLRRSADPRARRIGLALTLSLAGFGVDATFGFPLRSAAPPLVLAVLLGLLAALDLEEPRGVGRLALPWRLGLSPVVALVVMAAAASSSSLLRLEADGALYRAAFLPVVHAQGVPSGRECAPGLTIEHGEEGRLDLTARAVPLAEVLRCLVERAGLRLEYDGPPPRQKVSVDIQGQPLPAAIESLLEGLGVDFLLSRDPSGSSVDRLIVFGSARTPAAGNVPTAESPPAEPSPGETPQPVGRPAETSAGAGPAFPSRSVGPQPFPEAPEPGVEPEPAPPPPEPEELTPMTLQLGRRPGPSFVTTTDGCPVARSSTRGDGV